MTASIVQRLYELQDRQGHLDPEVVVADAADAGSPLHGCFQWDDGVAAHAYRIDQARSLIRSVQYDLVVYAREITTVQYVRNPAVGARERGYINARNVPAAGLSEDVMQAEIDRVLALYDRGLKIAMSLGLRDEYYAAVRAGIRKNPAG